MSRIQRIETGPRPRLGNAWNDDHSHWRSGTLTREDGLIRLFQARPVAPLPYTARGPTRLQPLDTGPMLKVAGRQNAASVRSLITPNV